MVRIASWAALFLMGALLVLSQEAAQAVRAGLSLCAASVVPALFPFLVLSSFFASAGQGSGGSRGLRFAGRMLGCGSRGAEVFFLSLLGGYPVGPRLIAQLCRAGQISREEAAHLLHFCNNAGPAFILGLVGLGRFDSLRQGVYLYLIHTTAAVLTSLLFRPQAPFPTEKPASAPVLPLSEALVNAIAGAGSTMVQLCAFVTFFYTVLQLFSSKTGISHPLALGFVELTQGVLALPDSRAGFVMAAALLGWGGLSVHAQTAAVLAGTGVPLRSHLRGKLCQAALSAALAFFVSFWA